MPSSSESTSLCTRDYITMVNETKHDHVKHPRENFQMNTFHNGLKAWLDLYCHRACPGSYLKYAFSFNKAKYDNRIGESPWQSLHYLICIITHGLFFWNARLFDDDVTKIGVSYWWRREFSNYAQFHRGRMSSPAQVIIQDNTRMGLEQYQKALYHLPCGAIITRSISTRILSMEPPPSLSLPTRRAGVSFVRSNSDVLPE